MLEELWEIQLLGGLQAKRAGRTITRFRTRPTASLFAYLAYFHDHAHPREILADTFWPECERKARRANLRVALSSLRRQLEPPDVPSGCVLQADSNNVRLNSKAVVTDVERFQQALIH